MRTSKESVTVRNLSEHCSRFLRANICLANLLSNENNRNWNFELSTLVTCCSCHYVAFYTHIFSSTREENSCNFFFLFSFDSLAGKAFLDEHANRFINHRPLLLSFHCRRVIRALSLPSERGFTCCDSKIVVYGYGIHRIYRHNSFFLSLHLMVWVFKFVRC